MFLSDALPYEIWTKRHEANVFYVNVTGISRRKTRRTIRLYVFRGTHLFDISAMVAQLYHFSLCSRGLIIKGVGMDMVYLTLVKLMHVLGDIQGEEAEICSLPCVNRYVLL